DATEVSERAEDFTGSESIPAIVVVTADQEMDEDTIASVTEVTEALAELDTVSGDVSPAIPSEDGLAVQVFVPLDADAVLSAAGGHLPRRHVAGRLLRRPRGGPRRHRRAAARGRPRGGAGDPADRVPLRAAAADRAVH